MRLSLVRGESVRGLCGSLAVIGLLAVGLTTAVAGPVAAAGPAALVPADGASVTAGSTGPNQVASPAAAAATASDASIETVTSPQGDSLTVSNVRYARLNPFDYVFGWCSSDAYASAGNNMTICANVTLTDSISGSQAPTNNNAHSVVYDACGQTVATWDLPGWHLQGTNYFESGTIYTTPYVVVPSNYCFGTWSATVSFTETFTDGVTLTDTNAGTFSVVPTQATPAGGAVQPNEQLGGCGCGHVSHGHVAKPVDTATGNFWHSFDDLATPGRGPALSLSRTYNSLAASTTARFGYGWTDTYGMSLAIGQSTTTVTQENGSQVPFTLNGSTWSAAPRVLATLVHNGDGTWTFTRRAQDILNFDATGRLIEIRDLNGYSTVVSYPNGSTQVVTDPVGRTYTFALSSGRVSSVTDAATPARSLTYTYNAAGDLTDVIDVGAGHWQFTYDTSHRMLTMRTPRYYGDTTTTPTPVTTNHYDTQGRVDWQSDALGRTTTFDYTSIANSTKVTNPKGNITVFGYQDGLLVSKSVGNGASGQADWTYRYDPNTLGLTATIDPNRRITTATYDTAGNKVTETDALSRTRTYTYNGLNEITSITEPRTVNGQPIVRSMTYDTAGNKLAESAPLLDAAGVTTATATTTYHYDDATHPGDITSVTDANGLSTTSAYDSYGDVASMTDPPTAENVSGNTTTYGYDTGRGWKTSMVAPKGNVSGANPALYTTTYAHDAYGRPTITKDPLWSATTPTQHQTVQHYDANGNIDSTTDGDNHTTTYVHDAEGQLTETHRADGTVEKVDYWADGTVHHQIDAANQSTTHDYDAAGHPSAVTDPLNRVTQLVYDGVGNLKTVTDPSSRVTTNAYDGADELVSVTYSDGITPNVTNISYDADGQRTAMTDGTGTPTWSYDTLHRLIGTTSGAGQTVGYAFDLGGRATGITYPGTTGTVTRHFDDANRMDWVKDWANRQTDFGYDENSNLVTRTNPNGTTATVTVDAADRAMAIKHAPTATPNSPFASFAYGRDGADQLTSVTSTGVPSDNHSWSYTQLNQLSVVDAAAYSYDPADNLTRRIDGIGQGYDVANQLRATAVPISLVGTTSGGNSTTNSLTLTLPAGKAANDQILLSATIPNNKSVTTPTGYTVIGTYSSGSGASAAKVVVYRRTALAGDTTVAISFGSIYAKSATLALYRNVNTTTPLDTTATSGATSSGTTVSAASLTAVTPLDHLVLINGANGTAGTWTAPTGMTVRVQQTGGSTDNAMTDQPLNQAVATGTRIATHSTSGGLVGVLIALKPVPSVYSYDTQGNRTSVTPPTGSATALAYDQANRLKSYTVTGSTATYTYNGDGLRASKTVNANTTNYIWDAAQTPSLLADGTSSYVYGPAGMLLEQVTGSIALNYHQDQLGSVRAVTDGTGAVVATYSYNPYGKVSGSTGTITNPFGFTGEYQDAESGLVYLRARFYDPTAGQFISRDPIASVTSVPYAYGNANPLNALDPSGLCVAGIFGKNCEVISTFHEAVTHPVESWKAGSPDYYTANATACAFGRCLGLDITVTRNGHVFGGVEGGVGSPGLTFGVREGWINQAHSRGACDIDDFANGASLSTEAFVPIPGLGPIGIDAQKQLTSRSDGTYQTGSEIGLGIGTGPSLTGTGTHMRQIYP